jgi:PAS domain S-box-containing protein
MTEPTATHMRIFDRSPVGVMRIDTEGRCTYSNAQVARIWGVPNLEGHSVRDLFPGDENWPVVEGQLKKRFEQGAANEYEALATRLRDKRQVPVRIAGTPEFGPQGQIIGSIAIIRDISLEQAIEHINHLLTLLRNSKELLESVAREVEKVIAFDLFNVSVYSRDGKHVRRLFAFEPHGGPEWGVRWYKMSPAMAEFTGNREFCAVDDTDELFKRPGFVELKQEMLKGERWAQRSRSFLRCPVIRGARVVASVSIGRSQPNAFDESEKELFRSFPLREAAIMALYFEDRQNLRFRLDLMQSIFSEWDEEGKAAQIIVQRLIENYDWENAAFFHVDEKRGKLSLISQKARNDDPDLLFPDKYEQSLDEGILGYVYRTKRPVNITNLSEDVEFKTIAKQVLKTKTVSELCLPVLIRGKVCWMLNLEDPRENAFSQEEVDELQTILDELKNLLDGVLMRHFVEAMVRSASDAIFVTDALGSISRVNPAVESLLGYSDGELIGSSISELLPAQQLLQEVLDGRKLSCDEVTLIRKDRAKLPVLLSSSPLPKELGGVVFIARDRTLSNRVKKLEYLGKMYHEIAVETKTPLALAFSWLNTIRTNERNPDSSDVFEAVSKVIQQLKKVELTFDRLALYDPNAGLIPYNEMLLSISEIIQQILDAFPKNERRKITQECEDGLPLIRGDLYQLTFCVRTILSYLLRFVPQEGSIPLRVTRNGGWITIRIAGFMPRRDTIALECEEGESLSRALADIALGENIIRGFVANQKGLYHDPVRKGEQMEFRIDLRGASTTQS